MLGLFKAKEKTDRIKILVVDDDRDLVETIQYGLERYQWEVITAANGMEGLTKAAGERPDLIVLDINMPVMDGHETLKCLRKNPEIKSIPVIICSLSSEVQDITRAASYNIFDYINKPFNLTRLTDKIANALEGI